jgi:hypothetical protein
LTTGIISFRCNFNSSWSVNSSGGAVNINAAGNTALTNGDQVKVIYAAVKDVANDNAAKTIHRSRGVKVTTEADDAGGQSTIYGTNYNDEMITLGVPDVFTIRGIYEANEFNADNYTYCSRYTTRYSMTWFHSSHARCKC